MLEKKRSPAPLAGGNRAGSKVTEHRNHTPVSEELQQLARDVRRIGNGYRSDPESIAMAKDRVAHRLTVIARRLAVAHG